KNWRSPSPSAPPESRLKTETNGGAVRKGRPSAFLPPLSCLHLSRSDWGRWIATKSRDGGGEPQVLPRRPPPPSRRFASIHLPRPPPRRSPPPPPPRLRRWRQSSLPHANRLSFTPPATLPSLHRDWEGPMTKITRAIALLACASALALSAVAQQPAQPAAASAL